MKVWEGKGEEGEEFEEMVRERGDGDVEWDEVNVHIRGEAPF